MKLFKKAPYFLLVAILIIALLYVYRPTMEGFDNQMSTLQVAGIVILLIVAIGFAIWWFFFRIWIVGKGIQLVGNFGSRISAAGNLERAQAEEIRARIAGQKATTSNSTSNSTVGGSRRRR